MNLSKSQIKSILNIGGQSVLLVLIFVFIGFVVPIRIAPGMADFLSITTPYESDRRAMSLRIENRNVSSGQTFTVGVSNPASDVRIASLSYSCQYSGITLAYVDGAEVKSIPCDTALDLPPISRHELMILTEKSEITYMPVEFLLEENGLIGSISLVVAVAARNARDLSRLPDVSTATLESFPANE